MRKVESILTVQELREEARKLGYKIVKVYPPRVSKYNKCKDCIWLDMQGEKTVIGYECKCIYKHFNNPTTAHYKAPSGKACKCFKATDDN